MKEYIIIKTIDADGKLSISDYVALSEKKYKPWKSLNSTAEVNDIKQLR